MLGLPTKLEPSLTTKVCRFGKVAAQVETFMVGSRKSYNKFSCFLEDDMEVDVIVAQVVRGDQKVFVSHDIFAWLLDVTTVSQTFQHNFIQSVCILSWWNNVPHFVSSPMEVVNSREVLVFTMNRKCCIVSAKVAVAVSYSL